MKKYIYKAVMYFSFQEREKREISNCLEEYNRLEELAGIFLSKQSTDLRKTCFCFLSLPCW